VDSGGDKLMDVGRESLALEPNQDAAKLWTAPPHILETVEEASMWLGRRSRPCLARHAVTGGIEAALLRSDCGEEEEAAASG